MGGYAEEIRKLHLRLAEMFQIENYPKLDARGLGIMNCARIVQVAFMIMHLVFNCSSSSDPERDRIITTTDNPEREKLIFVSKLLGLSSPTNLGPGVSDIEIFTKLSLVPLFQFQVENLFKNLLRELGESNIPSQYYRIVKKLLEVLDIEDIATKLDILSIPANIRNSLHANGIHHGRAVVVDVNGISYSFQDGKKVSCAGWLHITNIFHAVVDIIEEILHSSKVRAIEGPIKDQYSWEEAMSESEK